MGKYINEKLGISRRMLKKQAVKTIQDPISASEPVRVKLGGPTKDKMVSKLADFLEYLYAKYENAEITEAHKAQISKIVNEEIQSVKKILDKRSK